MRRLALAMAVLVTSIGSSMLAPSAVAAPPRDDDAEVCAATAKTVTEGLDQFVTDMEKVSTLASGGDLTGAQDAVKDAGATLVSLSDQLREEGAKAETPKLKETISDLADEFAKLGKSLTDLSSLEDFDTTVLDKLSESMSEICGTTPGPTTGLTPRPTGTPHTPGAPPGTTD